MNKIIILINLLLLPQLLYAEDGSIGPTSTASTSITLTIAPKIEVNKDNKTLNTNMEESTFHTETIILENGNKVILLIPE